MRKTTKWGLGIETFRYGFTLYFVWKMPNPEKVLFFFGIGASDKGTNFFGTQWRVWLNLYIYWKIINFSIPLGKKRLYERV